VIVVIRQFWEPDTNAYNAPTLISALLVLGRQSAGTKVAISFSPLRYLDATPPCTGMCYAMDVTRSLWV